MSSKIHPTAIVDPAAQIGANVEIGPYCVIGPKVKLDDHVKLISHVSIAGRTTVGAHTVVYPFASLGHPPQDLKFKGEDSALEIGTHNTIREHVTIHTGTEGGGMLTRIGNHCLIMASAHIAHDCKVGDHVVLANTATIAGHVSVGDHAIIGGLAGVHQFVRIGAHAMIGGMSAVENDVIPFGMVKGERAHLAGLNLVGLERRGFGREDIQSLRSAYRLLFAPEGTMAERLEEVARLYKDQEHISNLVDFMRARTNRALCQPRNDEEKGAA